jgi:hypothetical protein
MIEFFLGASIITVIYQGVKLHKVSQNVETLKQNEDEVIRTIYRNEELIDRRIDQEIERTDKLHSDAIEYINFRFDQKKVKKSKK